MRTLLATAAALLLAAAPAAAAGPSITVPICDLEGHCDKSCTVSTDLKRPVACR